MHCAFVLVKNCVCVCVCVCALMVRVTRVLVLCSLLTIYVILANSYGSFLTFVNCNTHSGPSSGIAT